MKNNLFALIFLISFSTLAQVKGVVKDSVTGNPIPYVTISVENENLGTTSEENGEYLIHTSGKSRNLIFSSLGFEKKKVAISKTAQVFLRPVDFQLEEVVVQNRKETKRIEIGQTDGGILEAFENGARIDVKFFPYSKSYRKTKFIKKVSIKTDSQIEASFKIHFYNVDANGYPGAELLNRDFIVTVGRGNLRTTFDVTKFNLVMPKSGIFVGFEKMMIEKNKVEKIIIDKETKVTQTKRIYAPMILYKWVARDFVFTYSGGKWNRQTNPEGSGDKMMVNEPAINLILTN